MLKMQWILGTALAGGLIFMTSSGCSRDGAVVIEIDGHVFNVPTEYLAQGDIPWLPGSQSDALRFLINPEAQPQELIRVTIESTETTCHSTAAPASNQLGSACAAASAGDEAVDEKQNFELERVNRDGDRTQWEYRLKGQGTVVASCFALDDNGSSGLCTSLRHFKDLVYAIRLRDSDVARLPSIRETVEGLLSSWQAGGKRRVAR
jgi:hypothetical protein